MRRRATKPRHMPLRTDSCAADLELDPRRRLTKKRSQPWWYMSEPGVTVALCAETMGAAAGIAEPTRADPAMNAKMAGTTMARPMRMTPPCKGSPGQRPGVALTAAPWRLEELSPSINISMRNVSH